MSHESTSEETEDEETRADTEWVRLDDVIASLSETQALELGGMGGLSPASSEEGLEDIEIRIEGRPGTASDAKVDRAIQQIHSASEEPSSSSSGAPEIAEQVRKLYDEDRLAAMRDLLEKHHLRIVQQLLASDTGALSPKEVAFRNEGIVSESTVRDHLRKLEKKGFVKKLEPDVETVPNVMPRTFYAASPLAIELLEEMGLWENLGMLYQIYESLERPEDVKRIEEWDGRPIPDWL